MKWWAYALVGLSIFAVGFFLGRSSRRDSSIPVAINVPDAGPQAVAVASTGPVSCDAGVVVRVVPGKPRPIYLPYDAGVVECPVCPTLEVSASASSLAGPTVAESTATAPPPVVVTRTEYTHKTWGVGPAFTKPYETGGLGYGATLQWQPLSWLELTGTFTTKEVMVSPTVRF